MRRFKLPRLHLPPLNVSRLGWAYLLLLALVWALGEWVAERTLPTLLLAYVPPVLLAWPAPILLLLVLLRLVRRGDVRGLFPALLSCGAALFYLGFTWHSAEPPQPSDFKLLTYNIARGRLGNVERLSNQIRAANADIITLQETNGVRWPFTDELLAKLPGYFVSRSGTLGAEVVTLSRFPVVSTREVVLPNTTRRFLVTRLKTPQGELTLINLHLSTVMLSKVLDGEAMTTRGNRQQQLEIFQREAAAISGPLIVAGDFNTPPRGRIYRALTAELSDAWDTAGRGFGYTFMASWPVLRIDHVLSRGSAAVKLSAVSAEVQPAGGSDHRALLVVLRFTPQQTQLP
ncbi:hypothetical protein EHF33_09265 [Deinococcus psychrotolerans]|uniref:Endonuclease/exonuclease/phosphatase domain-containing protein n=1 Tax=Deinococcus psychrotolerans TaxID=2489213 RepID=A0A3G8YK58_9DEIO|nr:endonuclease/exonuclease/phosphatase family protein [Deinococcus psychrotolerans]AZI42914.1 hypothetical protein EHF33_09265 [Deinococcus psychrotolerans]